jgi:hypothetical protein
MSKNIIEQKFGKLLVLEKTLERKRKNIVWKCLCDCGVICYKISTDLINNRIRSCGCLVEDQRLRSKPGEYGFNKLFKHYQENAKSRGYSFDLTKEYFASLTKLNCYYCGVSPQSISCPSDYKKSSDKAIENCKYIYNGLDRIDNQFGYTIDNVITCCEHCNRAKRMMSQLEFIRLANRISRLHPA